MKLFIVLALVAVAMGEPAVEKRAVQGIYHFSTGPVAAPLAVAPAPIPVATPFAAPAPVPVPVPVAHPVHVHPVHPPIVRAVPVPVPVAPVVRYSPPVLVKRYTVVRNVLPKLRFVY